MFTLEDVADWGEHFYIGEEGCNRSDLNREIAKRQSLRNTKELPFGSVEKVETNYVNRSIEEVSANYAIHSEKRIEPQVGIRDHQLLITLDELYLQDY